MIEDKQAVVEEKAAAAAPAAPETSARDDSLDTLLEEYDRSVRAQPTPDVGPPPQDAPGSPPEAIERMRRIEERLFKEDVDSTLKNILSSVDGVKIPKRAAIGWLDQMAREQPHIASAFLNRQNNPTMWKRMEKSLAREMEKEFRSMQVDEQATADREAVAASLRGASTRVTAEPAPNFSNQSNAEFRRACVEKYGFDPGV